MWWKNDYNDDYDDYYNDYNYNDNNWKANHYNRTEILKFKKIVNTLACKQYAII